MSEFKLAAENRSEAGKGAARRLRASGRVPAVLYGHGTKPQHLSVDARQFGQALRTDAGVNVLISRSGAKHLALAKEIQRYPVRGHLIHVDFIQVRRGEKVHVQVPVHLVGEALGPRAASSTRTSTSSTWRPRSRPPRRSTPTCPGWDRRRPAVRPQGPEGAVILDDPEASVVPVVVADGRA